MTSTSASSRFSSISEEGITSDRITDKSTDTPALPPSSSDLRKTTLADGLEKLEPSMSLSAGSLRGESNASGFALRDFDDKENLKTTEEISLDDEIAALSGSATSRNTSQNTDEDGLFTGPAVPLSAMRFPKWVDHVQTVAVVFSAVWITLSLILVITRLGPSLPSMMPQEIGGVLAGILAPVALLWLALTHITRTYDAQRYGEALRAELHALIFPSEDRQQRISHDIEKLCEQAAELAGSSRTVLKAIQKSRQALHQETREFVLLSRKAEVHIDKLAENLSDRVQKLQGITEDVERRTSTIDSRTKEGVKVWDETAAHILTKAEEIETALGRGAVKITDAAAMAQTKATDIETQLNSTVENLSTSIDTVAGRMTTLSSQFDDHGGNLSRASERVVEETKRLGMMIQSQISDLEGMSTGVFEAVAKSSAMVKEQSNTLDAGAVALARQTEEIVGKIKLSTDHLTDAARDVETRTADIEGRISRQADSLKTILYQLESQTRTVEHTGDNIAERLTESLSVALSGSETLSTSVRKAVESLQNAASESRAQAADILRMTTTSIDNLQQTGSAQMQRAEQIDQTLQSHRDLLIDSARKAEEQARDVLKLYDEQTISMGLAVTQLSEKLTAAALGIQSPLRAVEQAVNDADRRHDALEQTLMRRVDDLSRSSDKAKEAAEHIQNILRAQAQDLSILSGQISGQVRSIGDQIGQQKDQLGIQVERTVQDLDHVRAAIARQAESLSQVASDMNNDMSRLHDRINDRTGVLRSDAEGLTTRLYELDEKMSSSSSKLSELTSKVRDNADIAAATIDSTIDHAEPIYRRVLEQATATQDRFELLNRTFDTTASSNLERLQQIGAVFDDRLSQLRIGVQEAAQILRSSGDDLRQRVDDIESASMSASDRMNTVSGTLNNQISDIHLLTDQSLLKIENVQKAIENQFHELNVAVGKAVSELEGAQDQFTGAARTLDSSVESSVRKMQSAARDTVDESNVLQGAAASVIRTTQDMISSLQSESKVMLQSAGDTLLEIKKIADGFALRAHEVEEHMKSSLSTAQTYGRDLKTQAGLIAESSVDTADKIARAITQMTGKVTDVERAATTVGEKIEQVRGRLETEAVRFMNTAKQAVDAAEEASSSYARQSNVLFKAAQDAVAQIDKIKDVQGRAQRDAFLSSAKFVIESLHSLSVDFVRVLEGGVEDKTWKAFQKGDVAAFTRRLVQNMDQLPQDKVRAKFASDSEFRSYVQRFIRQFEDMFDQAISNDHGELLAATFLSSDIGRLYHTLCTVTGRDSKTGRNMAQAA